ncbi:MAG: hypothetical protein ACR2H1_04635 [Limisphaerales bacterium]
MNGPKVPDEKAVEMFHGKMVFTGDKIHYTVELPGFDMQLAYKLHPDQQPKAIDLELADILDKKGDRTEILWNLSFEEWQFEDLPQQNQSSRRLQCRRGFAQCADCSEAKRL